jgi:hypothetical protein
MRGVSGQNGASGSPGGPTKAGPAAGGSNPSRLEGKGNKVCASDNERSVVRDTAIDVVIAAGVGRTSLIDPALGAVAAGASPALAAGVKGFLDHLRERHRKKEEYVLAWAARIAGIAPEELQRRCEANPEIEQLLLRILSAIQETALREKLVAYALALGKGLGLQAGDEALQWESAFVRALHDLDLVHFKLLEQLSRHDDVERHPLLDPRGTFNEPQLRASVSDRTTLSIVMAVLQRHGLVMSQTAGGGPGILATEARTLWHITDFGIAALQHIQEVGDLLSSTQASDHP